jgi:hypothetical protein
MPRLEELDKVAGPVGMSALVVVFVIKSGRGTDP